MAVKTQAEDAPLADLTKFQRDLLVVIHAIRDRNHGLAIQAAIEDAYGEEINHGRLYPNLDQLAERGLIAKGKIDDRTNSYDLTDRGERELGADLRWRQAQAGDLVRKMGE